MMDTFNYNAPAELFPSKGKGFRRKMVSYRRFESAAVAIRYAIEELDPDKLIGAVLEIDAVSYTHLDSPVSPPNAREGLTRARRKAHFCPPPIPLLGPVFSSAVLNVTVTLPLLASRHARTLP